MKRCLLLFLCAPALAAAAPTYVITVSEATMSDAAWKPVVEKLQSKHHATVLTWKQSPDETLQSLQKAMPRFTCFVARPVEATRLFVQQVHRLSRRLDDDPYTDTLWGILTGFDATNALAIASESESLTIHKVGSGTELAMDRVETGTWYCELRKGHMVHQEKTGAPVTETVPQDTTKALVDLMNTAAPDLWVTSGHATERDWMIGFSYKNGFWKSKAGQLFGVDTSGARFDVHSPNPKIYLPVGNCLMGHIDGPDAMALAYMKSATVRQMAGYVLPTWYGYQGWGLLDYFVEQPGRFNLTEAFHANNLALVHRLLINFPGSEQIEAVNERGRSLKVSVEPKPSESATKNGLTKKDLAGLLFDRDNVAFYGDPAWMARMAPGKLNWEQQLMIDAAGKHTLTITPKAGAATWATVSANGSQRGGRPVIQFLPTRIDPKKIKITAGSDLQAVIADDFILIPSPAYTESPSILEFTTR